MSFVYYTDLATHFLCPEAKAMEDLLKAERIKADGFSNEMQNLQKDVQVLSERAQESLAKEKVLADRCKEQVISLELPFQPPLSHLRYQERQLQYADASASDSRKETEVLQRKLRELEEQMESDDRVARLENSLKHMQDRADELEFQLSKLRPVNFMYYFIILSVMTDVALVPDTYGFEIRTGRTRG